MASSASRDLYIFSRLLITLGNVLYVLYVSGFIVTCSDVLFTKTLCFDFVSRAFCVTVLLLFCVHLIVLVLLLATGLSAQHLNNQELN